MIISIYLLLAVLLLLLNAFFVLAEFAAVKARPTFMEALAVKGNRRAGIVENIQKHLDEYLSVCQVGITLASIGLGFVGEPAFVKLIEPGVRWIGLEGYSNKITSNVIAVGIAYVLVSFLHILIGELVPKSVAIRKTERAALLTAIPMVVFRYIFFFPIWLLNTAVNGILRLFRMPPVSGPGAHTQDEIRIILDHSQSSGMLSFRQLLHIENVLDMGVLTVRNAMRVKRHVHSLHLGMRREEIDRIISESRYSRYPVMEDHPEKPLGYIHIKDLYLAEHSGRPTTNFRPFIRSCMEAHENDKLENLLSEMQRKACHMAFVYSSEGLWSGIITLEDAVEEVIGTIEEEYPVEPRILLSDLLSPERTFLDVEGDSILTSARSALNRVKPQELPLSPDVIMLSVVEREKLASSYIGRGLAIPHARLKDLVTPMVIVARLKTPIPAPIPNEVINLLFLLLTPADTPRIHQILLSHIAGIFESEFLEGRLEAAATAGELYNVICTAEQVVLA
jgi:CBS domain containing-hemolysin-like protein/mannitol/fructose-specific phosphotransferase system IIA component (Ntr-type)